MADWSAVRRIVSGGDRFGVAGHVYPDGDAVGSTVALGRLLRRLGKEVLLLSPVPVPLSYRFLDPEGDIAVYDGSQDPLIARLDAFFMLDASTDDRLGRLLETVREYAIPLVCIDHHPDNAVEAGVKIVDNEACSTSQLVYELHGELGVEVDLPAAEAIYTGIHTDTVSFNFLGANARTHEIAARLLGLGVDPKAMWLKIYGNESADLMRLAGITLSGLRIDGSGRFALLTVEEEQWRSHGVEPSETEAFTRYPLTLKGVGVVALFCEERKGRTRVSLRALDATDVGSVARRFGGGGHRTSAGATVDGDLGDVVDAVLAALAGEEERRARREGATAKWRAGANGG